MTKPFDPDELLAIARRALGLEAGGRLMDVDLDRLVVRHRHVAPMLSTLLGATHAAVRITDAGRQAVILEREAGGIGDERFPIVVEGETVGWVEGDRVARAVAAVIALRRRPRGRQAKPRPGGARSVPRAEPRVRAGRDAQRAPERGGDRPGGACRGRPHAGGEGAAFLLLADRESAPALDARRRAGRAAQPHRPAARASSAASAAASRRSSTTSRADPRSSPAERGLGGR